MLYERSNVWDTICPILFSRPLPFNKKKFSLEEDKFCLDYIDLKVAFKIRSNFNEIINQTRPPFLLCSFLSLFLRPTLRIAPQALRSAFLALRLAHSPCNCRHLPYFINELSKSIMESHRFRNRNVFRLCVSTCFQTTDPSNPTRGTNEGVITCGIFNTI